MQTWAIIVKTVLGGLVVWDNIAEFTNLNDAKKCAEHLEFKEDEYKIIEQKIFESFNEFIKWEEEELKTN